MFLTWWSSRFVSLCFTDGQMVSLTIGEHDDQEAATHWLGTGDVVGLGIARGNLIAQL